MFELSGSTECPLYRKYSESASELDPEGESHKLRRIPNASRNTYGNICDNK